MSSRCGGGGKQACLGEFSKSPPGNAQLRAPLSACEQPGLVSTLICMAVGHPRQGMCMDISIHESWELYQAYSARTDPE